MAERSNIVFVVPTLAAGGAERVVTILARNLDRSKFGITLAIVDMRSAALLPEVPADVRVVDLTAHRVRFGLLRVAWMAWMERPDVIFSTLDHLNTGLAMTRWLWPRRVAFMARPGRSAASWIADERVRGKHFLLRMLARRADCIVFQTPEMQANFCETIHPVVPRRAVAIRNPVDVEAVQRSAKDPDVRTGYGKDAFNLVAVGRLVLVKGFDLLIAALALSRIDAMLTIVGEGPELEALKALAVQRGVGGRVRFAGYQQNPYPFIAQANALVLPSRSEGSPNVVWEALACSTRVIATPVSNIAQTLNRMPGCGVAENCTAEALADALRRLLGPKPDPNSSMPPVELPIGLDSVRDYEAAIVDTIRRRRSGQR